MKTKLPITITIEEGDDIVAITFFAAKLPKKAHVATIFCSKAIKEGDKSWRFLLLRYNETIEEDDDSLLSPFFAVAKRKLKNALQLKKDEHDGNKVTVTFFVALQENKKKEGDDNNVTLAIVTFFVAL